MAIWVVVAVLGVLGLVMMLRRRRAGALAHIPWVDGPWVPFLGNSVSVVWAKGDLAAVLAGPWSSRSFAVVDLQYPRILINDMSLAVAILNHKDMDKGPSKGAFKMLFGDGLASLVHQPELWKPHRTLLRPRFATSGLAPHLPDMHRIASTRIANALNGPQPLNISALCREVTFAVRAPTFFFGTPFFARSPDAQILFELIFEAPSNSHDFALILESLTELNRAFVFADLDVALAETPVIGPLLPGRSYRRCLELVGKVHAVSQRMCDVDSCPSIVNAMRESGSYTPAQVLDECLTLFFGGFDTTAISLLRTMVMLSQVRRTDGGGGGRKYFADPPGSILRPWRNCAMQWTLTGCRMMLSASTKWPLSRRRWMLSSKRGILSSFFLVLLLPVLTARRCPACGLTPQLVHMCATPRRTC